MRGPSAALHGCKADFGHTGQAFLEPPGWTFTSASGDFLLASSTPEPSTLLMLGSGVLGLAGVIRRKLN
jgi:hypothetical protein